METIYKTSLIVGIVIIIGFASIFLVPVFSMIGSNMIANHILSNTSNETFEADFAKIPEVKFFIEKYPNYITGHLADFLGWKIINYESKMDADRFIHLSVKKNVLHQGVNVYAGCSETGTDFVYNIIDDNVIDYLKNDQCLLAEELAELCQDDMCVFIIEDMDPTTDIEDSNSKYIEPTYNYTGIPDCDDTDSDCDVIQPEPICEEGYVYGDYGCVLEK